MATVQIEGFPDPSLEMGGVRVEIMGGRGQTTFSIAEPVRGGGFINLYLDQSEMKQLSLCAAAAVAEIARDPVEAEDFLGRITTPRSEADFKDPLEGGEL